MQVPRDREGQFHTQVFDRYSRYEPQVAQGLTQMFVAGTSTHKVGEVAETLTRVAPCAFSRLARLSSARAAAFTDLAPAVLFLEGVMGRRAGEA